MNPCAAPSYLPRYKYLLNWQKKYSYGSTASLIRPHEYPGVLYRDEEKKTITQLHAYEIFGSKIVRYR